MSDKNFTTHGNEPVEARIVAWVLGEASAFEIDELERLCKEQPELAVFKRRIEAVHGLTAEAHISKDDANWKLSSKMRASIEELIGIEETVHEEFARDFRVGRSGRRALLAIAACLVLTVVMAGLMTPLILSQKKSAGNYSPESAIYSGVEEMDGLYMEDGDSVVSYSFAEGNAEAKGLSKQQSDYLKSESEGREKAKKFMPASKSPMKESAPTESMAKRERRQDKGGKGSELGRKTKAAPDLDSVDPFAPAPASVAKPNSNLAPAGGVVLDGKDANTSLYFAQESTLSAAEPNPFPVVPANPSVAWSASDGEAIAGAGGGGNGVGQRVPQVGDMPIVGNLFSADKVVRREVTSGVMPSPAADPEPESQSAGPRGLTLTTDSRSLNPSDDFFGGDDNGPALTAKRPGQSASGEGEKAYLALRSLASRRSVDNDESGKAESEQFERLKNMELDESEALGDSFSLLSDVREGGLKEDSTIVTGSNRSGNFKVGEDNINGILNGVRELEQKGLADKEGTLDEVRFYAEKFDDMSKLAELRDELAHANADPAVIEELNKKLTLKVRAGLSTTEKPDEKKLREDPKKRPIPTGEEIVAAQEPYSTFSLNINDASFRVAQAALARGEMPDPTGIKVEQFYNAVDYGDPTPAAGQPVACNIEQSAHPVIPGRNLVRVALKTASEGRNQGQPLRLTLLIDQSGSMAREDRRAAMLEALDGLRGLLGENDQVNVIGFSRTPRLLGEAIKGNQGQLAQLVNIEANEGGTNLEEALKLGEQLAERHQLEGAQNRMVLFTDGAANLGDADPDSLADKIKDLRQKGIAFDIAGIVADGLNDELLGEMARHGNGRYYVVGKGEKDRFAEQLAGAFRPAAENVKVQVHFNPERVGRYKLIGFEKDRLNKEDFRNDAVDAAELAAEEAGVAIYQVETLPEGNGEIGEVSVRFRDVASGEMVERSWTIANEIATPALDQARPSMQLATLAMLAGEKLKGGPLSDAVNFNDMGEVIAKVNQHFKGDPKAAEMLHMVEQLK